MKIEIEANAERGTETVDVTFPHYFKQESDDIPAEFTFGKIDINKTIVVYEKADGEGYDIDVTRHPSVINTPELMWIRWFLSGDIKSTKQEFDNAKIRAQQFLKNI